MSQDLSLPSYFKALAPITLLSQSTFTVGFPVLLSTQVLPFLFSKRQHTNYSNSVGTSIVIFAEYQSF